MSNPPPAGQQFRNLRSGVIFSVRFDQGRFSGGFFSDEVPSAGLTNRAEYPVIPTLP